MSNCSNLGEPSVQSDSEKSEAAGSEENPYRIELAPITLRYSCAVTTCKRDYIKIEKGELRFGSWVQNFNDFVWRHWGCVTSKQIKNVQEIIGGNMENLSGFKGLADDAKEQVRLAFKEGKVIDKMFKGTTGLNVYDAIGFKFEYAKSGRSGCRAPACARSGLKIANGELRFGWLEDFDGEHCTWKFKHWLCTTPRDLASALAKVDNNLEDLEGLAELDEEIQEAVRESFKAGRVLELKSDSLAEILPTNPTNKAKTIKAEDAEALKRPVKCTARKRKSVKTEDSDEEEEVLVPTKAMKKRKEMKGESDDGKGEKIPKRATKKQKISEDEAMLRANKKMLTNEEKPVAGVELTTVDSKSIAVEDETINYGLRRSARLRKGVQTGLRAAAETIMAPPSTIKTEENGEDNPVTGAGRAAVKKASVKKAPVKKAPPHRSKAEKRSAPVALKSVASNGAKITLERMSEPAEEEIEPVNTAAEKVGDGLDIDNTGSIFGNGNE